MLSCMHMLMYTLENMHNNSPSHVKCWWWWWRVVLIHWFLVSGLQAQQAYLNNDQLDCDNNSNNTKGFVCNGPRKSCLSYLTFRSAPPSYDSPPSIAYLLNSNPSDIATINQISDVNKIPKDTVLIVPVNCSCSGHFYQYNASYTLKYDFENYFTLANNTYQGLTTCQALKAHNPYYYRNLSVGMDLLVPLMCACPTANQTAAGFNYLLTYLVTWGDYISSIADTFGVDDIQSIFDANSLSSDLIFPFTPILVPLKNPPTRIQTTLSPPTAPPPPKSPVIPNGGGADSSKKWVYVGVGIGAALLVLLMPSGIIFCLLRRRLQSRQDKPVPGAGGGTKKPSYSMENNISLSVSSGGIRHAVESLTVYKYEELQKAAGFFGEANRIKGCVYRGLIKGDDAAIKMMKGDVSEEINILKLINHSNVIRLSGFCVHKGNTYLVYEYAENGSLSDWLHGDGRIGSTLGWKQRVQIACDVANALNYLHNFTNPPCIHKNLKSSNILLDGNMRGKVANFGLARRLENEEEGGGRLQLTRHVVGTQGYIAPEYMENGLITPELDAFAFGVVILELLTGKEAVPSQNKGGRGVVCVSKRGA
ncbi:hypothetical protein PVL29_023038 [Vitis rotundifolia]|uniref:Uncharacterized protein n=1 Tax=Vitis rotundifolia TaxID=103349 RepID=A0AA39D8K1_VITRO|nr:hypothetical protein PVL29_023038 [Vitis rotundifolia]